jgi:hypothetical protein
MTLGNMRANGVRSLDVSCWQCHHRRIMSADPWPDHVPVPSFGPRMVCTRCGIIGADARPNWQEQPQRESLTGVGREQRRAPQLLAGLRRTMFAPGERRHPSAGEVGGL